MTNEELEKAMQFVLEQQAQFVANQQQVNERVSRLETSMAEMARAQTHMNKVVAVMADTHRYTEERLDAFIGVLERYISEAGMVRVPAATPPNKGLHPTRDTPAVL